MDLHLLLDYSVALDPNHSTLFITSALLLSALAVEILTGIIELGDYGYLVPALDGGSGVLAIGIGTVGAILVRLALTPTVVRVLRS